MVALVAGGAVGLAFAVVVAGLIVAATADNASRMARLAISSGRGRRTTATAMLFQ